MGFPFGTSVLPEINLVCTDLFLVSTDFQASGQKGDYSTQVTAQFPHFLLPVLDAETSKCLSLLVKM